MPGAGEVALAVVDDARACRAALALEHHLLGREHVRERGVRAGDRRVRDALSPSPAQRAPVATTTISAPYSRTAVRVEPRAGDHLDVREPLELDRAAS